MRYFIDFGLIIHVFFIVFSLPLWAETENSIATEALKNNAKIVMQAIENEEWDEAQTFAEQSGFEILSEIQSWFALRAGKGSLTECLDFLNNHADWPGLPYLQMACENNLVGSNDELVLSLTDFNKAMSANAYVKRAEALYKAGRYVEAEAEILHLNTTVNFSPEHFQSLIAIDEELYLPKALEAIRYEIFKRNFADAENFIKTLAKNLTPLMISQLSAYIDAMSDESIDEDGLLSGNYEGVYYYNAKLAYKNRDFVQSANWILGVDNAEFGLEFPNEWAELRADLSRRLIEIDEFSKAYQIASSHKIPSDYSEYSELEFLSGFIALEFLHNKTQARVHFQNLKKATISPISSGRAGFWLGQAGDNDGYRFAAKFQTSFYGQLSAEILGQGYDHTLINNAYSEWKNQKFLAQDSIYAGIIFASIEEELLAHRFFAHAAESLTPKEADALGQMVIDMNLPYSAVLIGKRVADRGLIASQSYYPFPHYNLQQSRSPIALTLAIMRQESEFYPLAKSPVGASGLMQIMPKTAQHLASYLGVNYDENFLIDYPNYNILLGSTYLNELLSTHDGLLPFVAAGYNAGPHRVQQWRTKLKSFENIHEAILWIEMIPFDETRNYVQRILESVWIYDAKIQQEYTYNPSDLLLKSYPLTRNYENSRAEFYNSRKMTPKANIDRPALRPD